MMKCELLRTLSILREMGQLGFCLLGVQGLASQGKAAPCIPPTVRRYLEPRMSPGILAKACMFSLLTLFKCRNPHGNKKDKHFINKSTLLVIVSFSKPS